jgi:hypothetical protein
MVQESATVTETAMVLLVVLLPDGVTAEAKVEVKPSVRSPRTTAGTTDLKSFVRVM